MSIAPGWSADEIRELVFEYERLPHGSKSLWLAEQPGVSAHRIRRWRAAVFDGDLDKGLEPRDGRQMTPVSQRRNAAKAQAAREAEMEQLQARVRELEQTNDVLGKAIGLLHAKNVEEPDESPTSSDPTSS